MILGIGTDIVELERIRELVQRQPRFLERILTEHERARLDSLTQHRLIEYIAGRFAAKEAVSKALGTGVGEAFSWQDIEILNQDNGAPRVNFRKNELKNLRIHLSISHSRKYAIAYVVIEEGQKKI